jgi:KUP system potassium uptake protein
VISGAFSITRQAILLGYIPRLEILHTSERAIGQIYIPFVNWMLFVAVVLLVLTFGSSERIAHAYGIAVSATMVIEVLLLAVVARRLWRWSRTAVVMMIGMMLVVDLTFLASNSTKFASGGWFPILFGAGIFAMLLTWKRGRTVLLRRMSEASIPLEPFLQQLHTLPPERVSGTAIFMSSTPDAVPHALLHNLKHNHVLHERIAIVTVETADRPWVPLDERVEFEKLGCGFYRILACYGFMQSPNVPAVLEQCAGREGFAAEPMTTSYFFGRDKFIARAAAGLGRWREAIFIFLQRNAISAANFFRIPANRTVELGTQIEI